jgi:hypothetical protein
MLIAIYWTKKHDPQLTADWNDSERFVACFTENARVKSDESCELEDVERDERTVIGLVRE